MKRFNFGKKKLTEKGLINVPLKRTDLTSLVDDFCSSGLGFFDTFNSPAIDIYEKDKKLVIKTDLPGMDKKDIKLRVDGDFLTIYGETKSDKEEKKDGYYYSERSFGKFQRSIRLPEGVKKDELKASYKDGVLTIETSMTEKLEDKGKDVAIE